MDKAEIIKNMNRFFDLHKLIMYAETEPERLELINELIEKAKVINEIMTPGKEFNEKEILDWFKIEKKPRGRNLFSKYDKEHFPLDKIHNHFYREFLQKGKIALNRVTEEKEVLKFSLPIGESLTLEIIPTQEEKKKVVEKGLGFTSQEMIFFKNISDFCYNNIEIIEGLEMTAQELFKAVKGGEAYRKRDYEELVEIIEICKHLSQLQTVIIDDYNPQYQKRIHNETLIDTRIETFSENGIIDHEKTRIIFKGLPYWLKYSISKKGASKVITLDKNAGKKFKSRDGVITRYRQILVPLALNNQKTVHYSKGKKVFTYETLAEYYPGCKNSPAMKKTRAVKEAVKIFKDLEERKLIKKLEDSREKITFEILKKDMV